ncbi:MAG: nitroreductase [Sneathiella sp.]|nr:nitroreductase [Sneathiella sp.]
MNIDEAITSRRSVRAFTDQPVEKEKIDHILQISQRAPSGTNTQPWYTYVCAGEVRDGICNDVCDLFDQGKASKYEDFDYYPPIWEDKHRKRRQGVGWGLYGLLGIEKGDRAGSARQAKRNFKLFDAPVGLFFTTDAYLGRGSWLDMGLYIQTIMLAARGQGLHTCPQAAWISFQDPIYKHLNIPKDQVLVCGMALGYEDTSAIENTLVSEREDKDHIVSYHGF